jgi:hypothetical protein
MRLWALPSTPLRQRDGVTCGPSVAIIASALLDADYGTELDAAGWFDAEQSRVHRDINRIWPRFLGTTPAAVARAVSRHSARRGVRYRWRLPARHDRLLDVREALLSGWPVAMLVGGFIPRHWVLLVEVLPPLPERSDGPGFRCYEPSSGEIRAVSTDAIRRARLTRLGYPRPFAFVLPARLM